MRKLKGFTLVELMIVMAVIAVLATMALVGFRAAQMAARDSERMQMIRGIQVGLECIMGDTGSYPPTGMSCASPGGSLPGCWTSGDLVDPLTGGDLCGTNPPCACAYAQGGGGATYTITFTGERGQTEVFSSPQ